MFQKLNPGKILKKKISRFFFFFLKNKKNSAQILHYSSGFNNFEKRSRLYYLYKISFEEF